MIELIDGKIILNSKNCNNPEVLFFTLKDYAEDNYLMIDLKLVKKAG
jgi:hypothetical protein